MRDAAFFLKEIDAASKREADYRKDGQRILDLYDGTKAKETPFNILYSNTETMLPALYSRTPRPVVQRRFKDEDPLGKAAAQAGQRMLEFLVDTDLDGYETFDHGMTMATKTALLPGRAATAVKYDAKEEGDSYSGETVCLETKAWNRVRYGYATCWEKVPWIAYEEYIDEAEAIRLFDDKIASLLTFSDQEHRTSDEDTTGTKEEPDQGERKVTAVWQIWDKDGGRRVVYVSEQIKDRFLKEEDDPLGLSGFYNCPRPLTFVEKPHTLSPTALYTLYESQANELNLLTSRIKKITKAIRARGLYDGELGEDLKKLTDADDAELVPTDRGSSLAAEKGLEHAIWFWPVDKLIVVVRELYAAREACKQVIYEITGISDILRGATKASETLGAQEIKAQWGTLRLKRNQTVVAGYAVDLLRMMLDIAAKKFSEETWAKMTGLPFLTSAKFTELTALAQVMQQQAQLRPPMPPQPGAPPDPIQQQMQQIQQQLQAPQWSQVLQLLQDDLHRAYRIDIETNSTVEPEAAEDQKLLNEVMTTLSQVLAQMGPLVVKGVLPFQAAQTLLLTIVRRFRFGAELEETIKAMQPPTPPESDGAAQAKQAQESLKMQEEMAKARITMQQEKAQMDLEMEVMQVEKSLLEQKLDLELEKMKLDLQQKTMQMGEQLVSEKLTMRDQVHKNSVSAEDKVRTLRDQTGKQQQSLVQQAGKSLTDNSQAIQQTVKQVQQLSDALGKIQQQAADTQALLAEVLKAAKAPRIKKAIRGKDGKIESVEETVAA